MSRVKRVSTAVSSVAFAILLSSSPASAQGTTTADGHHNAHRLGGSTPHSDEFTPAWMLHVGVPLGAHPVYFLAEGRFFLKEFDDVSNNCQFWSGVRVHF